MSQKHSIAVVARCLVQYGSTGQDEHIRGWGDQVVYCGKNVITSRISGSDRYQRVILVVQWGECSPIVEGII